MAVETRPVVYRNRYDRAERRQELLAEGKQTICRPCVNGHQTPCDSDDCCCICNELMKEATSRILS